jgi:ubiquinone/menaquinone biosynthesis C-methylase UbiE
LKMSAMAEKTARKYFGDIASTYDSKRTGQDKWLAEDALVRDMLDDLPAGTSVLDIPVGTGRFLPFYEAKGFDATGMDISRDMLAYAKRKGTNAALKEGNIFAIDMPDKSVDVVLAVRIMNLIDAKDMHISLCELQRVARQRIIFNLRVAIPNTKYRRPQKMETLLGAIQPGWSIMQDKAIHQDDFRMFMLCGG